LVKPAARVLLSASLIALLILLFAPIYVEPGNGHISCGRPWSPAATEEFLADDCRDAVAARRIQLGIAAAVAIIGGFGLIFAGRSSTTPVSKPA
jgi:hypothetical protein